MLCLDENKAPSRIRDGAAARFDPFPNAFATQRAIELPPGLAGADRARLVAKLQAVIRQQHALAEKCDAFLRVTGGLIDAGDRLLIPHEPATAADPNIVQQTEPRADIHTLWWLAWSTLRALDCLGRENVVHGGIQLETLYQDLTGRVKLGDVGLLPAFEAVLGTEIRRTIRCDADAGAGGGAGAAKRGSSGTWIPAGAGGRASHGWPAPYFAHELLLNKTHADWKTDQFALGVVLYLLAAGAHHYGAGLADPDAAFYYRLDPARLDEERADWRPIFSRQARKLSGPSDQPVLSWSGLVVRMLAGLPEDRFPKDIAAASGSAEHAAPQWREISTAIEAVRPDLDGRVTTELARRSAFWIRIPQLPALWRARLEQLRGSREPARPAAAPVREMQPAAAPVAFAADDERDRRAAEIELERHWLAGELAAARADLETGRFAAARQHATAVARHSRAGADQRTQADELLREIEARASTQGRLAQALYRGRVAARDGDVASVEECLSHVPSDVRSPELAAARNKLAASAEALRSSVSKSTAATDAAEPGREQPPAGVLEFIPASGRRETVPFPAEGAELIVGRGRRAGRRLPEDPWVSSVHLRFYSENGRPMVADLGSRHGTQVNGIRIETPAPLAPGDEVRLGVSLVRYGRITCAAGA
jgi:hypothetical protein